MIMVGVFQVVSLMSDVLSLSLKDKMHRLHEISRLANPLFSLQDFVNLHCLPAFDSFYPNYTLDTFCVPFFMFIEVLLDAGARDARLLLIRQVKPGRQVVALCFLFIHHHQAFPPILALAATLTF